MKILFKNARILDLKREDGFINGEVLVEDDKIKFVGKSCKESADRIVDANGNILMPGFIDCHTHSAMTILRGVGRDEDLHSWLFDNVFKLEEKLTEDDVYWGTMLAVSEYLRSGITTVDEYYMHNSSILKAFKDCKFRARVSICLPENKDNIATSLVDQLKNINNTPLVRPVVTAHSIYVPSEEEIVELINFARKNKLPMSIHLSETLNEVGDCTVQHDMTPPEYLENLGFFDGDTTCYHCVQVDKDDIDVLAQNDVKVVTCPSSNLKLASGFAPLFAMKEKGILLGIGTDGAASNDSLDMFKEMFLAATLEKARLNDAAVMKTKEVLKMATENGAKILGFDSLGEIKAGNFADLILIDVHKPHFQPVKNLLSHLVYSAKSSDVYLTMINGEILYENGILNLPVSEEKIMQKVNEIYDRLIEKN